MRWFSLGKLICTATILGSAACSLDDVTESPRATATDEGIPSTDQPLPSSIVTAEDIPSDVYEDSWARLPLLDRESLDADGQRAFNVIVNPESRYATGLRGPIGMWA